VKVAYFSPLPPKRTGIATYSWYLIPALSKHTKLDLFDHGYSQSPTPDCDVYDYVADPSHALNLDRYDACLYHIGNQPDYHGEIYRIALRKPGVIVLHDAIIYFLAAGGGPGALLKELCFNQHRSALQEWHEILAQSPNGDILRYPHPQRFPLLVRLLRQARALIVHSETTKRFVTNAGYDGPIHVVHMIAPNPLNLTPGTDSGSVRAELGVPDDALLIGAFGFIGATKRLDALLRALERLRNDVSFRLLIVGIGDQLSTLLRGSRVRDRVVQCGFVTDRDFLRYLRAVDVLVNLRHPSMGEASLTLIQAMAQGLPCIVTNDAWFSELPDDCVWKTRCDESESEDVIRAIAALATDENLRRTFGEAASRYIRSYCVPDQVGAEYFAVLRSLTSSSAAELAKSYRHAEAACLPARNEMDQGDGADSWLRMYFDRRIQRALP
jgi:glycosyltransferase involved in cell wall biosynthesis